MEQTTGVWNVVSPRAGQFHRNGTRGCKSSGERGRWCGWLAILFWIAFAYGLGAASADFKQAQQAFLAGDYNQTIDLAQQALSDRQPEDEWPLLLTQAFLVTGRYPEARTAITNALARDRWNLRLCWQAREVFLNNGQPEAAAEAIERVLRMVSRHQEDYRDAPSLVVLGQAALLAGADPKRVLDLVFDAAKKADPNYRESYLQAGNLALDKHDFALAAKKLQEGLKQLPNDPDLHCGMAKAYASSDPALMQTELGTALERNSNHVASLLLLVDHNIDAEDYDEASKFLDRIHAINPRQPEAWAYKAVLAHLRNDPAAEKSARENGLKFWPGNPRVDHVIGLKLSQNYRFTEGAERQRQALQLDPSFLAAKAQLAEDLLRLGEEAEGWQLAEEVQKLDNYDVQAYNLTALHDTMRKYATLTNANFLLRISPHEAAVYGSRALDLLERARVKLCAKYGVELKPPTIVEVFSQQKDFAVRTFGMPGNPGYLGVCFGRVVTANSPAAHVGHAVNWEAVLWHEFCHVVTLQLTRNKMPRWLSEGISVYEERQENPAWGEHMNPDYREMILGDDLTPVSKLSEAFLAPRSAQHLQFAYYESSLVVEFLVQRFGLASLKAILQDLGQGLEINAVIAKHTQPMSAIEREFAIFARDRAEMLGPGLDWEKPQFEIAGGSVRGMRRSRPDSGSATTNALTEPVTTQSLAEAWANWGRARPTNFWVLAHRGEELIKAKEWSEAKKVLSQLLEHYPEFTGSDSPYRLLAAAHRGLGETNEERKVLGALAQRDDEAIDAYARLMELDNAAADWAAVTNNAQRFLAVDPLVALPYRFLAKASEKTGQAQTAIMAYKTLLQLEPTDPAEVHFRLARLLHQAGDPGAKRQVLQALEEAPRYREALKLLLEIEKATASRGSGGT